MISCCHIALIVSTYLARRCERRGQALPPGIFLFGSVFDEVTIRRSLWKAEAMTKRIELPKQAAPKLPRAMKVSRAGEPRAGGEDRGRRSAAAGGKAASFCNLNCLPQKTGRSTSANFPQLDSCRRACPRPPVQR